MPEFLTFEDAKTVTYQIINFFNSPDSDPTITALANQFNLGIRDTFLVTVTSIEKNCPECSGCHGGSCTLGCHISQDNGSAGKLCYWDKALTEVAGTKLIVHEMGHVIYDQIFIDNLSPKDSFNQSERFAQYMENHYDFDMSFNFDGFNSNPQIQKLDFTGMKESGIRIIELVIIFVAAGVITYVITQKFTKAKRIKN